MDKIYFLIDGENIDATLGVNILKRFPRGEERPRWDRVLRYNPWADHPDEDFSHQLAETIYQHTETTADESAEDARNIQDQNNDAHVTPAIFANGMMHHVETTNDSHFLPEKDENLSLQNENEINENEIAESKIETKGLFFLNASQRVAKSFVQALLAIGWQPILLTSEDAELKIVDLGIQRTLEAIVKDKPKSKVVIASHDVDYLPQIEMLLEAGHDVAVLCFREYLSLSLAELEERGLKIVDLEYDVDAFTIPLSRVSTIEIDEYNPYDFI